MYHGLKYENINNGEKKAFSNDDNDNDYDGNMHENDYHNNHDNDRNNAYDPEQGIIYEGHNDYDIDNGDYDNHDNDNYDTNNNINDTDNEKFLSHRENIIYDDGEL
jgi:E3 ubiquitin-protein ligase HUWE1